MRLCDLRHVRSPPNSLGSPNSRRRSRSKSPSGAHGARSEGVRARLAPRSLKLYVAKRRIETRWASSKSLDAVATSRPRGCGCGGAYRELQVILRYNIDLETHTLTVETLDGRRLETRVPETLLSGHPSVRKLGVDFKRNELLLTLSSRVEVAVELDPASDARAALEGRKVVYLDQNKWSELAAWRYGHRPLAARVSAAAGRLAELVRDRKIVLPMSAGHLVETSPLYGGRREALAATVLEFSRSWQMRNPLVVRREELRNAVQEERPAASNVFSLEADAIFSRRLGKRQAARDLPESFRRIFPRIVDASSIYETLVDDDPLPDQGGRAAAEGWAKAERELSAKIKADGLPRERVRPAVGIHILHDLAEDLAAIKAEQLYPGRVGAWIESTALHDLSLMPYLARVCAVTYARFQREHNWEHNDLIDVHFLCCAAGYADVVVAERRTAGDIRTATAIPEGAHIASTLEDAVNFLESS